MTAPDGSKTPVAQAARNPAVWRRLERWTRTDLCLHSFKERTQREGALARSLARVHNFAISIDGFGTGEGQTQEAPFGHAGHRLHEWMLATQFWNEMVGKLGGSSGIDDAFSQRFASGIGAEIMGAHKFGPPGWHDDPDWKGWWGTNPPFHTPTFILTHQPRPWIEMEGGTTFRFMDASPAEALEIARELRAVRTYASAEAPR